MESRLKKESIREYSKVVGKKLCDDFFKKNHSVSGPEILKFSEIKQLNLFILMQLYLNWENELHRLKSPYFDYENEEVVLAMKAFHNSLSNHIKIDRKHFEVLIIDACEKTIHLIFSPYHFYVDELRSEKEVNVESLEKIKKYIRINQNLLNSLIEELKKLDGSSFISGEVVQIFDRVCSTVDGPEDFSPYLIEFSKTEALSLADIYEDDDKEEKNEESKILNDRYSGKKETLNDKIKARLDSTLAEIHQNSGIDSISRSLSINQRFMFTKELFGGDKDALTNAVLELDAASGIEDAMTLVEQQYASNYKWNIESTEVEEFLSLIKRRFA